MIFLFPTRSSPSFEQTWKPLRILCVKFGCNWLMALWKKLKVYRFTKLIRRRTNHQFTWGFSSGVQKTETPHNVLNLYRKFQSNLKLLFNCISIISNCIVIILICDAIIAQVVNHRNVNNAGACADTFCSLPCETWCLLSIKISL